MSSPVPKITEEMAEEVDAHKIREVGTSGERVNIANPRGNTLGVEDDFPHQVGLEEIKAIERRLRIVEGLKWYEVKGVLP